MDRQAQEVRKALARYLAGELRLDAFVEAFVPLSLEAEPGADPFGVASEIEGRLAEYSAGHWSEDELRARLEPLATAYRVQVGSAPVGFGAASNVIQREVIRLVQVRLAHWVRGLTVSRTPAEAESALPDGHPA